MIMYHATFGAYLPQILANGIMPGQHKNWTDSSGQHVYLAYDADVAASFCECADEVPDEIYDSGIVVLSVNVDGLCLYHDPNIRSADNECAIYAGIIEPWRITTTNTY